MFCFIEGGDVNLLAYSVGIVNQLIISFSSALFVDTFGTLPAVVWGPNVISMILTHVSMYGWRTWVLLKRSYLLWVLLQLSGASVKLGTWLVFKRNGHPNRVQSCLEFPFGLMIRVSCREGKRKAGVQRCAKLLERVTTEVFQAKHSWASWIPRLEAGWSCDSRFHRVVWWFMTQEEEVARDGQ